MAVFNPPSIIMINPEFQKSNPDFFSLMSDEMLLNLRLQSPDLLESDLYEALLREIELRAKRGAKNLAPGNANVGTDQDNDFLPLNSTDPKPSTEGLGDNSNRIAS